MVYQKKAGQLRQSPDQVMTSDKYFITLPISLAESQKCERCWHYQADIGQFSAHPSLCERCVAVLASLEAQPSPFGHSNPDRWR